MKKTAFLFLVLSQLLIHCSAQQPASKPAPNPASNPASKFSAEILLGPSIPLGKFSDKSATSNPAASDGSGLAKVGPALQLAFNYHFKSSYGLTLLFAGQENNRDAGPMNASLKQSYPNATGYNTSAKSWKAGKIMAGGFVHLPLSDGGKWYFQGKLLAGILKTSLPGYSYTVYGVFSNTPMVVANGTFSGISLPWTFCYQLDAGLSRKLSEKVSLLADVNYFHAVPTWKYTYYQGLPPNGGGTPVETKFPITCLNIMAGIGFRF